MSDKLPARISNLPVTERKQARLPAIEGVYELRFKRIPRRGKIHLGVKIVQGDKSYPREVPWFVFKDEMAEAICLSKASDADIIYDNEQPHLKALRVMLPCNEPSDNISLTLNKYSKTKGLLCYSADGVTRRCVNNNGEWEDGKCLNSACPDYLSGACKMIARLRVFLPDVPGLGVWQIDSASKTFVSRILETMAWIYEVVTQGQLAGLEFRLERNPVSIPDKNTGKLQTHYIPELLWMRSINELRAEAEAARGSEVPAEVIEDFDTEIADEDTSDAEDMQEAEVIAEEKTEPAAKPVRTEEQRLQEMRKKMLFFLSAVFGKGEGARIQAIKYLNEKLKNKETELFAAYKEASIDKLCILIDDLKARLAEIEKACAEADSHIIEEKPKQQVMIEGIRASGNNDNATS